MNFKISNKKVVIFFLIISLLPFVGKCGHMSQGFPTPSIQFDSGNDFESIMPINLLVNLGCIALFSFLFIKYTRKFWKNVNFTGGIIGIIIYHIIHVVAHALFFFDIEWAFYLAWPIYFPIVLLTQVPKTFYEILPSVFSDSEEVLSRITYVLAVGVYYLVGHYGTKLVLHVKKKRKHSVQKK